MLLKLSDLPPDTLLIKPIDHRLIRIKSKPLSFIPRVGTSFQKESTTEPPVAFKQVLWQMVKTCHEFGGIGLAAPQISIFSRMFIIKEELNSNDIVYRAYLNPSWKKTKTSEMIKGIEGCLSVEKGKLSLEILRPNEIEAIWFEYDENGDLILRQEILKNDVCRVFQHEYSHLQKLSILDLYKKQKK